MSMHEHTQRVLLVDDSAEVRKDLRLLLEIAGEVQVIGEPEKELLGAIGPHRITHH